MKHFFRTLCTALMTIFAIGTTVGQQMPPIPVDTNVRIGKLDNGLTYYIRHNELPENRADFYIAQKVGSILEEDSQRGLAHFLEHMCFNGTTHFPGDALKNYLETIGVRFGENLNAYTSVDETVYNISNVPVSRDGIVDSCLLILHDWSNDLTLDPVEIDKERGVIHEEWRTRTGAMMRMYERAFPIIYEGSRYGNRLPIGTMEVVDNFPYQVLRDYYEKWYRPDQQGIVVVGDIDVDKVEAKIKSMFADIEMPKDAAERVYYPVPDNKEPIITIEKDKEQPNVMMFVFNKHEAIPNEAKSTMDYMVLTYAMDMISQMLNVRLSELTQTPNPPFIFAETYDSDFFVAKTKDAFTGIAASKDDGIETALRTLLREMARAHQFGFTATEYERAKAEYLSHLESAYNERDKQKNDQLVNQYVRHFIDNEPIPGIENEFAIMNQIVPNIPVEAINQIMGQLISGENLVVSIFCPDKEGMKLPVKEDILKIINEVKAEKIEAYVDKVSNEPLMAKTPKAGKVVKTQDGPMGTKVMTLSNGVKVVLKKTDYKADEILMKAFSLGGSSLFPTEEIINIESMNDVIQVGGLGNFSVVELQKVLAGKKASASANIGNLTEGVNGSCAPKDLETMMQLTYLLFTAPRMDMDAFNSYKSRTKASLENMEVNPMIAFSDSLQAALFNHHPRAIRIKADMVDKIDYSKIMEMYKDRFKDASDFTFILVGNIDEEAAKPLIETYLASLPSINRKETYRDNKMYFRKGEYKNVFTQKMETPKATTLTFYSADMPFTLENAILAEATEQVLDMVYTEEVREKEGGTYGVGIFATLKKYPKEQAYMQIVFDTDPDKCEKMVDIVLKEAEKAANEGPKAEYLKKVKEFMLKKHKENLKENGYWLNALNDYYFMDYNSVEGYEKIVEGLTTAKIQKFLKDLLSQKNRTEVIMTGVKE